MEESKITTVSKQMTLSPQDVERWVELISQNSRYRPNEPISKTFSLLLFFNDPIDYYLEHFRYCYEVVVGSSYFIGRVSKGSPIKGTPLNRINEWDALLKEFIKAEKTQAEYLGQLRRNLLKNPVIGEFR